MATSPATGRSPCLTLSVYPVAAIPPPSRSMPQRHTTSVSRQTRSSPPSLRSGAAPAESRTSRPTAIRRPGMKTAMIGNHFDTAIAPSRADAMAATSAVTPALIWMTAPPAKSRLARDGEPSAPPTARKPGCHRRPRPRTRRRPGKTGTGPARQGPRHQRQCQGRRHRMEQRPHGRGVAPSLSAASIDQDIAETQPPDRDHHQRAERHGHRIEHVLLSTMPP